MQYFLLGLAALAGALLLVRLFAQANPATIARRLRAVGSVILLAVAVVMVTRGLLSYALPLGLVALWLFSGSSLKRRRSSSAGAPPGRRSNIVTDHLEMELDLDSGRISGRVLKGFFAGRDIETLAPVEMALLWQDCRFSDPQSAQILEAYLDRVHPSWQEDMARAEADSGLGPDGAMTREQALDILGLKPGATRDDIRKAHRELMLKMHPDRGGSTYLAAKINEAKDVLLGER